MAIIYMGSFDDRVYHYPWTFSKLTRKLYLKSYLNSIVQNTVIGHKSAINDGYLLNNPVLRDSLFSDEPSFLRDILKTGEIVIPSRQPSFAELINQQVKHGISSFAKVPKRVLKQLNQVDSELNNFNARTSGPASSHIWYAFNDLMSSLQNRPFSELELPHYVNEDDYRRALDSFLNLPDDTKPPSRTQWEMVLTTLSNKHFDNGGFTFGKHTKSALMNIGNEAYHYSFAKTLSDHSNQRIDLETVHTPAFSHLLDEKRLDISANQGSFQLIEIPRINNLLKRGSIEKLLEPSNQIGRARLEFLKSLADFERNATDAFLNELKYKAKFYNELLNYEFGKPDHVNNIASAANFAISITSALGSLSVGNLPSIIIAILSWGVGNMASRIITNKFCTDSQPVTDYSKYSMASTKLKEA